MKSYDEMFGGQFLVKPKTFSNNDLFYFQIQTDSTIQQSLSKTVKQKTPENSVLQSMKKTDKGEESNTNVEITSTEVSYNDNDISEEQTEPTVSVQSDDIIVKEVNSVKEPSSEVAVYENVEEFEVKKGLFGRLIAKRKKTK